MQKIILKSKVVGILDGVELLAPYRLVLTKKDGKVLISPEQSFKTKDGYEYNEHSGLPSWYFDSLARCYSYDMILIDMGAKWGIKGLQEALREAERVLLERALEK